MIPESEKVTLIKQTIGKDRGLIIAGEITNFFDVPVIQQGKTVSAETTLFLAPKKDLSEAGALRRMLNRVHAHVPDSKRAATIVQGSGDYRSIRFGYLYTDEPIADSTDQKKDSIRSIELRVYPTLSLAKFLVEYQQEKSRSRTASDLRLESLTYGMLETELGRLIRNPAEFLQSIKTIGGR